MAGLLGRLFLGGCVSPFLRTVLRSAFSLLHGLQGGWKGGGTVSVLAVTRSSRV